MSRDLAWRMAVTLGAILLWRIGDDLSLPGLNFSVWVYSVDPAAAGVMFE